MMNFLVEIMSTVRNIFYRFKRRDFSGYAGLAAKNSMYMFMTNFFGKVFSFIFIMIMARILMPELFGLYSLALTTILLFVGLSELGIGETFIRFVSKELGRKRLKKAKAYAFYIVKIRIIAVSVAAILLLIFSKFISHVYYDKPIFLALLAGAAYIVFLGAASTILLFFTSMNDFRANLFKEIIFQILRLIIVPLAVLYLISNNFSPEIIIFSTILILSFISFVPFLFLLYLSKGISFIKEKKTYLRNKEKEKVNKLMLQLFLLGISGLFLTQIDMVFLGRFVLPEFIGYYAVAISFIGSFGSMIILSGALLPIFSRLKGDRLERGFNKAIKITLLVSILLVILTLISAKIFVNIIYGEAYLSSISFLRLLSLLVISTPIISMYTTYFISRGKPKIVTKGLLISITINIILNYLLISWLIRYSQTMAVWGVGIATIASSYIYLIILIRGKNKLKN